MNCHMPATLYMQREARRDHSFSIPNPLLAQTAGAPLACTGCHTDRDAAWAGTHLEEWFGTRDTPRNPLAHAIAVLREGSSRTPPLLRDTAVEHPQPAWRATAVGLLGSHPERANLETARAAAIDVDGWVRAAAARALGGLAESGFPEARAPLRKLLDDPLRAVRVEAGRALRRDFDPDDAQVADLAGQLTQHLHGPAARAELGLAEARPATIATARRGPQPRR